MGYYGNKPQNIPGSTGQHIDASYSLKGMLPPPVAGTSSYVPPAKQKDPDRWRRRRNGAAVATIVCLVLVMVDVALGAKSGVAQWGLLALAPGVLTVAMHLKVRQDRRSRR
jgi:hypothetical protein